MAAALGVASRRYNEWEQDKRLPDADVVSKLADITSDLDRSWLAGLSRSVMRSSLPRALSRGDRLTLQALSGPAIDKRPSIMNWIGEDLAPIASGLLEEMMADAALQRAIERRDVVGVVATTRSVLKTAESETVGAYRTSISYFYHAGVRYSDAVSVPVSLDERTGYTPIGSDEIGADLFGDFDALAAGLMPPPSACCA